MQKVKPADAGNVRWLRETHQRGTIMDDNGSQEQGKSLGTFGAKICSIRQSLGISQAQFAALIGTYQSRVSYWELGYGCPTGTTLHKIVTFLKTKVEGLTADMLFADEDLPVLRVEPNPASAATLLATPNRRPSMARKHSGLAAPSPDSDPFHVKLSRLVDARRAGRTDGEIAEAAGMTPQAFSRLLNGGVPGAKIVTLQAVLRALGADFVDYGKA